MNVQRLCKYNSDVFLCETKCIFLYNFILLLQRAAIISGFSVCSIRATLYPLSIRLAE